MKLQNVGRREQKSGFVIKSSYTWNREPVSRYYVAGGRNSTSNFMLATIYARENQAQQAADRELADIKSWAKFNPVRNIKVDVIPVTVTLG